MGHIGILVVVVRRLSRRWKVKTLLVLAGPSPSSPMKAEITISPISNTACVYCSRAATEYYSMNYGAGHEVSQHINRAD